MAPADVIVIGGGAAGVAAALAAREAGARVRMIRRALGATALSSGAVDVAADPGELAGDPWEDRPSAMHSLERQARTSREHPLSRTGLSGTEAERILQQICQQVPLLHHRPLDREPLILPTDLGTFKSTSLCQITQVGGHLLGLRGSRIGVVGIRGYPLHDCHLLADSFIHHARRGGIGLDAVGLEVEIIALRGNELMHPSEMAIKLQQETTLERLASDLDRQVSAHALSHLLLPPLMGLDRWQDVLERLGRVVQVAEMLASPPSVPGLRLQRDLDAALARRQIILLHDRVTGYECGTERIDGVRLAGGDLLRADAFVLATGRFIGQGLRHRRNLHEPIFDLPVWIGREGPNPGYLGKYMSRAVTGPHPLMSAGVRVDERLRPLPGWRNLFAAGSVIGGYDYISGRCGLGTALLTGHLAGSAAAGGAA